MIIMPPSEFKNAIVFCEDCKEKIISVMDHLREYPMSLILLEPINKQFPDHMDHSVCILTPFEDME